MATSSDQVERLLALVPYLQSHPRAEVSLTAKAFGVTPRQLLADLHVLWFCGLPGGLPDDLIEIDMDAVESDGTITLSNAPYLARPMRFTPGEAVSLVVALRAMKEVVTGPLADAVDSALAKLSSAAAATPGPEVGVQVNSGAADVREALTAAIDAGERVRLDYAPASRTEPDEPLVDPSVIVLVDGFAYLQGWALARKAWRTYRLDRIHAVERASQRVDDHGAPPAFDAAWLDARPNVVTATLDVTSDAAWIAEYYPVVRSLAIRGGQRVTLKVADLEWLQALLLRLGPGIKRVHPPELGVPAARAATSALRLYGASPRG